MASARSQRRLRQYLEPKDGFKEYTGDLPKGLEPKDKSKDVRKKLGDPETAEDGFPTCVNAWWNYSTKGITVKFSSPTADEANTVVGGLVLFKPEPEN